MSHNLFRISLVRGDNKQEMKIYKGGPTNFAGLEILRLSGKFCNVILRVGTHDVAAHKVVLLTLSPYFWTMFTGPLSDENKRIFELKGVNDEATASLVQFAYTGELCVDVNNVQSLYTAANFFQIEKVKVFCEEFLVENLEIENAFGVHHLGEFFTSVALSERVNTFISNNFAEITSVANDEFLGLKKDSLVGLLSRSDLVVNSENDVWNAINTWIEHDKGNRGKFVYELLQKMRLSLVKLKDLDIIAESPLIASSTDCMNRIDDARTYKLEPHRRDEIDVGERTRRGYPEGRIYILGGGRPGGVPTSEIETFVGDNFEQTSSMQIKRAFPGVAVLNGNVHITGGFDDEQDFNSCELYSPSNGKSILINPMNFKRSGHGCCTHKGKIYVCGGKDGFPSSCCERLETSEKKWRFIASMNDQRRSFAVVSCGEYIWAFGGRDPKDEALDSIEFYDERNDLWTLSFPMFSERFDHSAVAFRNNVYLLGGKNGQTSLNSIEVFDTVAEQITCIRPLKFPRSYFGAAISGEKIYCFGGFTNGYLDSVESFNMITWERKKEKKLPQKVTCLAAATAYEA